MKPTYEELAAQNDYLQNLCCQLCTAVSDMDDCEENSNEMESAIDHLFQITRRVYCVVHGTPQQALAEIRAEAGRAGYLQAIHDLGYRDSCLTDRANKYAEQIRQGGAE
jgi:uncharacterized membrane protein YccC